MFIGHWAPALAAATHRRAPGLGTLFIAAQLVDWGFFTLLLLGAEHMRLVPGITVMNPMDLYDMPYTHSLLGSELWAAAFGVLVWRLRRDRLAGVIAAAVVLSHWLLDWLVHRPDLTLAGAPPRLGLGLWNHPAIEMPLELGLTFAALAFYLARTRPVSPRSALAVGALAAALALFQAINWFGKPATVVSASISLLAFFAYAVATALATWLGITRTRNPARG